MTKYLSLSFILLSSLLLNLSCSRQVPLQAGFGVNRFALTNTTPIHYVESGKGPTVILLPGLFATHRTWDLITPLLQTRYRLLAIDNFGTGASGRQIDGFTYSPAEQADIIVAMMDELNITSCHFIGASYGGMIALNIAARYPKRVATVVCIEGAVIMPRKPPYKMLEKGLSYPVIGEIIIGMIQSGLFDEMIAEDIIGTQWDELKADEKDQVVDIITNNVGAASRQSWHGLTSALNKGLYFSEEAKSIIAPVLYLYGEKSSFREMTKININFFKKNLPGVRVISFANGVHDLHLQKPRETAALIFDFIE